MKKLMIAASAAFCAAVGLADVESANVVGYNTVDINPGYNMFAVNFKQMGESASIKIDDLFAGGGKSDTVFKYGATSADADYLMVWDNAIGDYSTYYLFKKKKGSDAKDYYWCNASDDSLASSVTFKNGDAFWFYRRGDKVSATTSGEVELNDVKTITINAGYNMIGSYFPTGFAINDATYYTASYWEKSGAKYGATSADADYLMVWDNAMNDYTTFYLFKKKKGSDAKDYQWCNASDDSLATGNVLTPGKGAWYYHRGTGFNLEIKKQF